MMFSQIQDALLLLLLPLVGGLIGGGAVFLLTTRRAPRRAEAAVPLPPSQVERRGPARLALDALMPRWTSRSHAGPAKAAPSHTADLLLVDDSAVARAKLRRLFERAGYTVDLACDGLEALALLDKGSYAMMITDLEMPNMNGVTLINTCLDRPNTAHMPMLAISGHEGLRATFNECRDIAGVHRKPWVDDILLSHVATLVSARRGRVAVAG